MIDSIETVGDIEMTKEELSEKLQARDNEVEQLSAEIQILRQNEAVLKDTVIRLSMKLVGIM